MSLPATITAGDTLVLRTSVPDYPASAGWVLTYRIFPREGNAPAVQFACIADAQAPAVHAADIDAQVTALWLPGPYGWASWATLGAFTRSVAAGSVRVLPDPRTVIVGDSRSMAQRALDDAQAALASWSPTTRSYTIGDRQMTFASVNEILPLISYWRTEVQREQRAADRAAGRPGRRAFAVRMGR